MKNVDKNFNKYLGWVILCFLSSGSVVLGQLLPDAPITNFMVPGFAENGYREWVLEGASLKYRNEDELEVQQLKLQVFSGDELQIMTTELRSPEALFYIKENAAFSNGDIEIDGPNYKIKGKKWRWEGVGSAKKIWVDENPEVVFFESIEGFLK